MEFGALIPLFYMGLCFQIFTPIIGVILLLIIRFKLRDQALAKIIFYILLTVSFVWFLIPIVQLIIGAIHICRYCLDSTFRITGEIIRDTLLHGLWLALMPGTATGFLVAFIIVTPINVIVRARKERKTNEIELNTGKPRIQAVSVNTTVKVKCRIAFSDLEDAIFVFERSHRSNFASYLGAALLLYGLFQLCVVGLDPLGFVSLAIGMYFLMSGFIYFAFLLVHRRYRGMHENEYDVIIDNKGVHAKKGPLDAPRSWDGYRLVVEDENTFLFIYANVGLFAIPKRVLSPEAISQLRAIVVDNVMNYRSLVLRWWEQKNW
jgi:hypothetical protein